MSTGRENQFILRLPKELAEKTREALRTDTLRDRLKLDFYSDQRHARIKFDDDTLSGKLVDLPCIVESHKSLDDKTLYKTGDISQLLLCTQDPVEVPQEKLDELPLAKRKEMAKKFTWNHGVAPPLKNVRKRRFRKTAPKKFIDSPEIERELRRLVREDLQAVNVTFKVVNEEGKQDDTQSVASENTSRAHTPALSQDDESLMSSLADDATAKSELLRVFEEVSGSSSSDEDEGNDIAVDKSDDEVTPNPEVVQLQGVIQDLENQIEEHKSKILNTANAILKARFETFLTELETRRAAKIEELNQLTE